MIGSILPVISSIDVSFISVSNLQKPWPFTILVGLISRSYSCNAVTELALFSPNSFWISNFPTAEKGTINLTWAFRRKGIKYLIALYSAKAFFSTPE